MNTVETNVRAEIIRRYVNGESQEELARSFGRKQSTIGANLRRWGVVTRRVGPRRRYTLDATFFNVIDTEEKAYWLGFVFADGSVIRPGAGNWILRIELHRRDEGHLRKFLTALQSTVPVKPSKDPRYCYVQICSRELCDGLKHHGCVPNKTAVHGTPILRKDLYRHFYRGVTDGDGSLLSYRTGTSYGWRYELVGSPTFVREFQEWLVPLALVRFTKLASSGRVLAVRYTGSEQVERIGRLLYADSTVYLDRKYASFERLISRKTMCG
jgi:hypothetical protein